MNGRRYLKLAGLGPVAALMLAGAAVAQQPTVEQHTTTTTTTPSGGTVTEHSTSVSTPDAYNPDAAATAEHKTVTHRDASGEVTHQTQVEHSQDATGTTTTVKKTTPNAAPSSGY